LSNDNEEDRQLFESCQLKGKRVVNPIVDWKDADIWGYARSENICLNPLYQCGFNRVGCIGCPMAAKKGRQFEFARYPRYQAMYIAAFDRMLEERKRRGKTQGNMRWGETAEEVFHWWMEDGVLPGQMELDLTGEDPEADNAQL
jgi:phosphoadenosine phosphosulfate reductase